MPITRAVSGASLRAHLVSALDEFRAVLARRRWLSWAVAVAGAAGAAAAFAAVTAEANSARTEWGQSTPVWVAAHDHDIGDLLEVRRLSVPLAVVPSQAVSGDPVDGIARQQLTAGEIVVAVDVAAADDPTGLAPAESVVVFVSDPLVVTAAVGAHVQVVSDGIVLADDGVVVGAHDGVISVAVEARSAPMVAAAAAHSSASLVFPVAAPR